eukprot:CAMPEP_0168335614 /NCGR_PEP_ID=MMETSP0213-20121227/11019_1 /TAXON_ID=151035 /ORGANISM="Euplotes harpa, Strain FSP1.4" /LENGTH=169 /DNA_ID=CAMNT_0008340585 /DNA_START=138 /DNA_END=647 /DNA_ORIENTATION=-
MTDLELNDENVSSAKIGVYILDFPQNNSLQFNKGGIKEEEKHSFICELNRDFSMVNEGERSPKSEPDLKIENTVRNNVKLFKTHSMNVNKSSKVKSADTVLKVDSEHVLKNLKFSQNSQNRKMNEMPMRLLDSIEILKQLKTQRRDYSDSFNNFKNLIVVEGEDLEAVE